MIPIVILTDASIRSWRSQAAIISARSGLIVTYVSIRLIQPIFPHRRIIGPYLMPLSRKSLEEIKKQKAVCLVNSKTPIIRFVGSLYEPRISLLKEIQQKLLQHGFNLELLGRDFGGIRYPDQEYWQRLFDAEIVITTTEQAYAKNIDWGWNRQLVYRFLEATACNTILVAQNTPGIERYFTPNIHFLAYENPDDAVTTILWAINNPKESLKIATAGHLRACALIESRSYWTGIDIYLSENSLC